MGAMAAGLAAMGAIIMPIIIGAGAGAAPPPRDSLLGSSTVSTTCTIPCRGHSTHERTVRETPCREHFYVYRIQIACRGHHVTEQSDPITVPQLCSLHP